MAQAQHPFATLDATAQAELVRRREASPAELVDAAIARIEVVNPALNAVTHKLYDRARNQAAQPVGEGLMALHGTDAKAESGSTLLVLEQIIPVQAVPCEQGLL